MLYKRKFFNPHNTLLQMASEVGFFGAIALFYGDIRIVGAAIVAVATVYALSPLAFACVSHHNIGNLCYHIAKGRYIWWHDRKGGLFMAAISSAFFTLGFIFTIMLLRLGDIVGYITLSMMGLARIINYISHYYNAKQSKSTCWEEFSHKELF